MDECSQVSGERLGSPVLKDDGSDDENGDGEEVVVPGRVEGSVSDAGFGSSRKR